MTKSQLNKKIAEAEVKFDFKARNVKETENYYILERRGSDKMLLPPIAIVKQTGEIFAYNPVIFGE